MAGRHFLDTLAGSRLGVRLLRRSRACSPSSPSRRSRSASAARPPSSRSSTPSSCGRCRCGIRTALSRSRSSRAATGRTTRITYPLFDRLRTANTHARRDLRVDVHTPPERPHRWPDRHRLAPATSAAATTRRWAWRRSWGGSSRPTTICLAGRLPSSSATTTGSAASRAIRPLSARTPLVGDFHYTIVGIEPTGFTGTNVGLAPDVTFALRASRDGTTGGQPWEATTWTWIEVMGRLRTGVSFEQSAQELTTIFRAMGSGIPQPAERGAADHLSGEWPSRRTELPPLQLRAAPPPDAHDAGGGACCWPASTSRRCCSRAPKRAATRSRCGSRSAPAADASCDNCSPNRRSFPPQAVPSACCSRGGRVLRCCERRCATPPTSPSISPPMRACSASRSRCARSPVSCLACCPRCARPDGCTPGCVKGCVDRGGGASSTRSSPRRPRSPSCSSSSRRSSCAASTISGPAIRGTCGPMSRCSPPTQSSRERRGTTPCGPTARCSMQCAAFQACGARACRRWRRSARTSTS